jgi:hypothetical protein
LRVWILTEENNTGDSEHDTVIVSVHATEQGAKDAEATAIEEAQSQGKVVYGESDDEYDDAEDWNISFEIEEWEVEP